MIGALEDFVRQRTRGKEMGTSYKGDVNVLVNVKIRRILQRHGRLLRRIPELRLHKLYLLRCGCGFIIVCKCELYTGAYYPRFDIYSLRCKEIINEIFVFFIWLNLRLQAKHDIPLFPL